MATFYFLSTALVHVQRKTGHCKAVKPSSGVTSQPLSGKQNAANERFG